MDWPKMDWPKLFCFGWPKTDWPKTVSSFHRQSPQHCFHFFFISMISDRNVTGHNCLEMSWENPQHVFHIKQRNKHTFISLTSNSYKKDITHIFQDEKMYNSLVQQVADHTQRQDISRQVHHSNVCDQSDSIIRRTCFIEDISSVPRL